MTKKTTSAQKPRVSACPAEYRAGWWGWHDGHLYLKDANERRLYEAHRTQLWKTVPKVKPAYAKDALLGGILMRDEQTRARS